MITADHIKLALLRYFRFKRQWITVDECLHADVVADTGKYIIEVEVKVSKADLFRDKKKQWKHQNLKEGFYKNYMPNKFYYCVPYCLRREALELVQEINPKYGVIIYCHNEDPDLATIKNAMLLKGGYSDQHRHQIAKRASCKLITLLEDKLNAKP